MITEIFQIEVKPGTEKDYEAGVAKAATLTPAKGDASSAEPDQRGSLCLPILFCRARSKTKRSIRNMRKQRGRSWSALAQSL